MLMSSKAKENLRVADRLYESGESSLRFMPVIYQIEPTSSCNLDCVMCPNRDVPNKALMDLGLFRKIIDEVGEYARVIKLSYIGEPMLHPNIVEMIEYAKRNSAAKITMFTNGTRMSHGASVDIVRSGLDEIVFSIDGHSREVYEAIRRRANYDEVVRNVEDFILYKGERLPKTLINFVILDANRHEMEIFRSKWETFGCEVKFSWLSTWSGQLGIEKLSDTRSPSLPMPRNHCAEFWYKALVNAHGDVLLCCNDYLSSVSFGNLNQHRMEEIWNGQAMNSARKSHLQRAFKNIALCRSCMEWSTKEDMHNYLPESSIHVARP